MSVSPDIQFYAADNENCDILHFNYDRTYKNIFGHDKKYIPITKPPSSWDKYTEENGMWKVIIVIEKGCRPDIYPNLSSNESCEYLG